MPLAGGVLLAAFAGSPGLVLGWVCAWVGLAMILPFRRLAAAGVGFFASWLVVAIAWAAGGNAPRVPSTTATPVTQTVATTTAPLKVVPGSRVEPTATPRTPPPAPEPPLELLAVRGTIEHGYYTVEGQVRNTTSRPMKNVTAVATFYSNAGDFITSDDALVDYNPLLPGQTSPFSVMARHNPEMRRHTVEFKELLGGTIDHADNTARKKQR